MLVKVSVERMEPENEMQRYRGFKGRRDHHEVFTVYIGEQRILTVFTSSPTVMAKWISDLRRAYRNRKQPLVVGFCVDREVDSRKRFRDKPFEVLTLCVGSQCLIYGLPEGNFWSRFPPNPSSYNDPAPKPLKEFLGDSNTICVGMHTGSVAEKLERDQELKMKRAVDLYRLMLNVTGYPSLHRSIDYELDELIKMLLDKKIDVTRRKFEEYPWTDRDGKEFEINSEYVKFLTVDAFYASEIGIKHLDRIIKMA